MSPGISKTVGELQEAMTSRTPGAHSLSGTLLGAAKALFRERGAAGFYKGLGGGLNSLFEAFRARPSVFTRFLFEGFRFEALRRYL